MSAVQNPRVTKSISIASATSLSQTVDLEGYRIAALDISSGWDAANRMTFSVSPNATTFYDLYDNAGNEYQIASGTPFTSATGRAIIPDSALALALLANQFVRFRSGPATAAAALTTGVTINAILVPM